MGKVLLKFILRGEFVLLIKNIELINCSAIFQAPVPVALQMDISKKDGIQCNKKIK